MLEAGKFYELPVIRMVDFGVYLEDGEEGILLPKRFVPQGISTGNIVRVFIYHDGEDRLIATTQQPNAQVGDIARLTCVNTTPQGAFLDNGLMKDLFVPAAAQVNGMRLKGEYLVKVYRDEETGRMAASEKFENELNNADLTVKILDEVDLTVMRRTDIGYLVIINDQHTGVLHFNEIYRTIGTGDKFRGYIKNITPGEDGENKIDVAAGKPGYERVKDESGRILQLLEENGNFLPYHDKSDPEEIYQFFGMSKKTFKMVTGNLYRERKITFEKDGIRLVNS
ncbi:MAG: S1-like domain-containing RNA-binding protein [Ferruginibacter sp.]